MKFKNGIRLLAMSTILALGVVGCTADEPASEPAPQDPTVPAASPSGNQKKLDVVSTSESSSPVVPENSYNYTPTALYDRGTYSLWWCGAGVGVPGDDALYAYSAEPDRDFTFRTHEGDLLSALSGQDGAFDSMHICDPNVIRVDDTYYMYYTGSTGGRTTWGRNKVGLATSSDGVSWARTNGGNAIVTQSGVVDRGDETYGAGQPAAAFRDGYFYLSITDTTAAGGDPDKGQGQFIIRSTDPEFQRGVEIFDGRTFEPTSAPSSPRNHALLKAVSVDLKWVPQLNQWAVAHEVLGGTEIVFFNEDFGTSEYEPVRVDGPWAEGPGLVSANQGRVLLDEDQPCSVLPIALYRATKRNAHDAPTGIKYFETRFSGFDSTCSDPGSTVELLEGASVPSSGRDGARLLISDGKIYQFANGVMADAIAGQSLNVVPESIKAIQPDVVISENAEFHKAGQQYWLEDGAKAWPVRGTPNLTIAEPNLIASSKGMPVSADTSETLG